jgi:two-component SAPR family response regulator
MDDIIYIVDDDIFFSRMLMHKLTNCGYSQVYSFNSGLGFLHEMKVKPDFVFLDHDLGDLTGFEVLQKLQSFSPQTEVVMISSHYKNSIEEQALEMGVMRYISKVESTLNQKIDEVIESIRLRMAI